jgi:hypothetical protein
MVASTRPGKEAAREYLLQRMRERTPPPPQCEIRRRLGWEPVKSSETAHKLEAVYRTNGENR